MTRVAAKLRRRLATIAPMAKDPRFWGTQLVVFGIATAHSVLENPAHFPGDIVDFLPVSFFWVPLMYGALRFGLPGAVATSLLTVAASLPNWLYLQASSTLPQEVSLVISAAAVSLLVGRQADRVLAAQRSARSYAALAARSQEEERRQLSLDLHDDSIQALISVCHELDSTEDPPQHRLRELRDSIAGVVQRLREISVSLRPPSLDDLGMVAAVRGLLNHADAKVSFSGQLGVTGEQRRLPADVELTVFRIAQEALRNVERHSQASQVRVSIAFVPKGVIVEVADDGVGFDAPAFRDPPTGHLGLLSMRERAEMVGGRVNIRSRPGRGTRVTAYLPLLSKQAVAE